MSVTTASTFQEEEERGFSLLYKKAKKKIAFNIGQSKTCWKGITTVAEESGWQV